MTSAEIRQSFLDFFREKEHSIVPSSSLLPSSPNLLFTNAGMNQFVPYFLGAEQAPYQPARAADTQKCIRAGGKHNDLDDVGLDTYHHTFFEMLGNWSFGDYFKAEAIGWAWELLVDRWKFPPGRLYATVYRPGEGDPGEFDQEAYDNWAYWFKSVGLDPAVHIVDGNKKDNFWMMGETGPCGPCSELHVDLTQAGDTQGTLVNKGDGRCIEIWNLVFIQFNATPDGTFTALPARHVDTGMGFERVVSIIQGTGNFTDFNYYISNYDTDVFRPLFDAIEAICGHKYTSSQPAMGTTGANDQERIDIAFRVVADHLRTLSFAIADGILPGNNDRNYVLRRILRRAVKYGRTLGFKEPFFYQLVPALVAQMGGVFPELAASEERIISTLKTEEESFNRTLDRGIALFEEEAAKLPEGGQISGALAFRLSDEQGFPLDLTQVMARERGLTVDEDGFKALLEEQKDRARAAQKKEVITVQENEPEDTFQTEFVGYVRDNCVANVEAVREEGDTAYAVVNRSPFYAEMGGQVGDAGIIGVSGKPDVAITNTIKHGNTYLLRLANKEDAAVLSEGRLVSLEIDPVRRRATEAHHTATHLLHWALHEIVGQDATQKGSYVGPDRLRFDFNSAALSPEQVTAIEDLVNRRTLANDPVTWREVPHAAVRDRRDIMQFFSDKYGETVRVVQIGGSQSGLDGYSMELCAGTHVRATGEVGAFKIVSEGAISAGVRRIEALAGWAALQFFKEQAATQTARVKELETKLSDLAKAQEKDKAGAIKKDAENFVESLWAKIDTSASVPRVIERVDLGEAGPELLASALAALKTRKFKGVAVLAGVGTGEDKSVHLAVGVSPEFTAKYNAGKLLQQLAPIVGGKGGGKGDLARGAGKDAGKIPELLKRAVSLLGGAGGGASGGAGNAGSGSGSGKAEKTAPPASDKPTPSADK